MSAQDEFNDVLDTLKAWKKHENDPRRLEIIERLIEGMEQGLLLLEEAIEGAKMIGYRNPAFDGDMVGWWDDDDEDNEDKD